MMVGGSSALNLSLLSRGVGEITKNGHEKIDVVFEPQDYYNFVNDSRRIYLPPIQPSYAYDEPSFSLSRASKKSVQEISMPKTFTTRKGALLLFSEDMAQRKRHTHHHVRKSHLGFDDRESQLSKSADEIDLRTVDDLAKSILSFGAQDPDREEGVYLKFVHGRRKRDYFDRQIRPGFSAKRYLSSWTKCWDDNVLEKVISKGYLTEKSLFYYNPLMPHLQRRLNDDMSHYPTPYKLMRSMLMSPGSLSGYTFYRIRPESAETIMTQDVDIHGVPPSQGASIKVISTKDGVQREVTYGSLDKKAQEEVLTDLLVKSAVHYAMKKQQEYLEDNLIRAIETNKIHELSEGQETPTSMPQFNMQEAVESLLDTQRSKGAVIEADLPEDRSSEKSGSLKPKQPIKRHGKDRARSTSSSPAPEEKEYIGGVPVVSFRDGSGSPSSVPQLPHIPGTAPLTPIGEMSREQTTVVPLPPIGKEETKNKIDIPIGSIPALHIQPPTPQHTILESYDATGQKNGNLKSVSEADTDEDWTAQVSQSRVADHTSTKGDVETESKKDKGEVSSHVKGSTESSGTGVHSIRESKPNRTHWKGSQTSVRSSKKGSGSIDDGSVKGSVIMGPEGEIINVGGTIKPHLRDIDMVQDANKVFGKDLASDDSEADDQPDEWKKHRTLPPGARDQMKNFANKRDSANSKVSEKEIMDALADHAQQIAQNVLSRSVSGKDLEEDVRSIVQEIIAGQEKRKSAGPTAGEYRELIKANLKTAVSSTSGENVPVDTEVSPELLDTLAKEDIAPEDLEIVQDDDGKSLIRSKSQVSMAMGGVKEGHIYVPVAKNGQKGPATSIPVDRQSNADIGELAVIHYSGEKDLVKESSEKTPSDRGSKTKSHPPSTLGESIAEEDQIPDDASEPKSHVSFKDEVEIEDEFQKAIQGLEQKSDKQSVKSAKTESDGKKSKVSVDKSTTPIKKKEEFIVGKVDTKDDIKALYGQPDPPPKEPSPPTMAKKASPVKESPPLPSPPKSAEFMVIFSKKSQELEDIPFHKGGNPISNPAMPVLDSLRKKSKDEEPKKLAVDDKSIKSASTAKSSTTGTKTMTSVKSEEMGKGKSKKVPSPTKKPAAPKEVKPKAKGKGKGKKKEESPEPKPAEPEPVAPVEPPKEPTPPPPTPPPPKEEPPSDPETDRESMSDLKSEESFEFHIVRDSPSPSPPPTKAPSIPSVEEEPETEDEEPPEDEDKGVKKQIVKKTKDEAARLRMISNREARAAKRAAQAEKRRQEVEKRRREREDQLKREKEEFERQQQLKAELEEERRRQEEQRRLRRELADAERDDEERREEERLRRQKLEEEKERRRKEEYQRKLEEMRKRQAEEEKRRHEEMLKKQEEEEEAKRLEAEKMAAMEEEERRQYEIQKKLEEEERLRKEEEERLRREEEARKAMEEARRLAEEMARKQAEMEARLKFNRTLQVEAHGLEHSQDITRAFVFSYFELLQWLGLDIPEFELLKLNQY
ncbi:calponin homology domain-containing protein DDB_G0272472-like isoform X30 [Ostrea edulis]|uniref:calponin homology domain-containing protein DDB_G0272472-like isoform X30 n=1 Tax=Ostrea edulis TaxID=37623 RepID=UPI0024AEE1AB|nr:calponin homology domain-containing protein DDB_G0272472-like isoform X30 [Ostrea edulis]